MAMAMAECRAAVGSSHRRGRSASHPACRSVAPAALLQEDPRDDAEASTQSASPSRLAGTTPRSARARCAPENPGRTRVRGRPGWRPRPRPRRSPGPAGIVTGLVGEEVGVGKDEVHTLAQHHDRIAGGQEAPLRAARLGHDQDVARGEVELEACVDWRRGTPGVVGEARGAVPDPCVVTQLAQVLDVAIDHLHPATRGRQVGRHEADHGAHPRTAGPLEAEPSEHPTVCSRRRNRGLSTCGSSATGRLCSCQASSELQYVAWPAFSGSHPGRVS